MEINGKYLAWAMIHFSFFLVFVFVDFDIDYTKGFFDVLGNLLLVFGLWVFFGWRFIENMKEAFGNKKEYKR